MTAVQVLLNLRVRLLLLRRQGQEAPRPRCLELLSRVHPEPQRPLDRSLAGLLSQWVLLHGSFSHASVFLNETFVIHITKRGLKSNVYSCISKESKPQAYLKFTDGARSRTTNIAYCAGVVHSLLSDHSNVWREYVTRIPFANRIEANDHISLLSPMIHFQSQIVWLHM